VTDGPPLLSAPDAVLSEVLLAGTGPCADQPLVAVDLDRAGGGADLTALRAAPVVVVGVAHQPVPAELLRGVDVLLAADPGAAGRAGVVVADVDEALADLAAEIGASPAASVSLVQLLRAGDGLDVAAAVVAESWVYSMLQAGAVHQAWLSARAAMAPKVQAGDVVRAGRNGGRLDVVLDRPQVRNAVSARLRDEVHDALLVALGDASVEEVHLWGAGPAFCSGGDLAEFGTSPDPVTAHLVRTTRSPALDLARCASRLTAHVHGTAVGAGVEWAAFAARVVARADATFRLPEVAMGLVPGAGGTASVPRRIGRHRAAHLALTGGAIDASTALAWGLVDEVVDPDRFGEPEA
jgi:enoyl-CoA hydratase/carnithine racemase